MEKPHYEPGSLMSHLSGSTPKATFDLPPNRGSSRQWFIVCVVLLGTVMAVGIWLWREETGEFLLGLGL